MLFGSPDTEESWFSLLVLEDDFLALLEMREEFGMLVLLVVVLAVVDDSLALASLEV